MQVSIDLSDPGNPQRQTEFGICSFPTGRSPRLALDKIYLPVALRKTLVNQIVNPGLS